MNLWEFFKSESLWTFDHIVWFDHREEWNIRCVDALRSDGSELKRYMMQVLEVYILAFALVFSCVSTFLVDFDAAENTIEVVYYTMSATMAFMTMCGTGLAISAYTVLGIVSPANMFALMKANSSYVPFLRMTFVSSIYLFCIMQGLILYDKVAPYSKFTAAIACATYSTLFFLMANWAGYFVSSLSRSAMFSGSLGDNSRECVLKSQRDSIKTDDQMVDAFLRTAVNNAKSAYNKGTHMYQREAKDGVGLDIGDTKASDNDDSNSVKSQVQNKAIILAC